MLNPADGVTLPKLAAREVRVLDAAETARLLAAAERPDAQHRARLRAPLMVTVGTGLRLGELLGLRWCERERLAAGHKESDRRGERIEELEAALAHERDCRAAIVAEYGKRGPSAS